MDEWMLKIRKSENVLPTQRTQITMFYWQFVCNLFNFLSSEFRSLTRVSSRETDKPQSFRRNSAKFIHIRRVLAINAMISFPFAVSVCSLCVKLNSLVSDSDSHSGHDPHPPPTGPPKKLINHFLLFSIKRYTYERRWICIHDGEDRSQHG